MGHGRGKGNRQKKGRWSRGNLAQGGQARKGIQWGGTEIGKETWLIKGKRA